MSELTQTFVVQPNDITITVDTNNINFTPTATQLSIYTGAPSVAGGSNTQLQFNDNNQFGGIPNVTWNGSNLSLGNVANVKMTGGTNGYVLQTDGTGNLSWTVQTGGGGNGSPGGSNTQIQYNDNGLFGGNVGFTFNETNGDVNIPGNLSLGGVFTGSVANAVFANTAGNANYANFAGQVVSSAQPNITSTGTLLNLSVTGNVTTDTLNTSGANIQYGKEGVDILGSISGTYNFNILDGGIRYSTSNAPGNLVLNLRANSTISMNTFLGVGESTTATYLMTTGSTGYVISSIQIDGSSQTINYSGTAIAVANCVTAYTYTVIKTAATPTYTVLGSITRYI
jgi:hypothetical protein